MIAEKELTQITLDATASSDIVWRIEQEQAEQVLQRKGRILWGFEFGCTSLRGFRLQDVLQWNAHRLAIDHFTTSIWSKYKNISVGISLFQGSLDWFHHLYWDEAQKEHFNLWKSVSPIPGAVTCEVKTSRLPPQNRDILFLYAIEQLSNYLHRLNAYLPEEPVRFVSFDITESLSIWRVAQALSKERFPYILIDTHHPAISSLHTQGVRPGNIALCLPKDEHLTPVIGELWGAIYIALQKKSIPFRVIPELFMAEEWMDLEKIIVLTEGLSELGRRQLQGFSLSGGEIIFYGNSLELPNSIHWEDWIG